MHRRNSSRRSSRRRNRRRKMSVISATSGPTDVLGDGDEDDLVKELDNDGRNDVRDNNDDDNDDGGDDDGDNDDGDNDKNTRDAVAEMVNQEIILYKISRCKELIETMKTKTWPMSKKMKLLRKARGYVEKVEGKLSRSKGYQQRWNQLIRQTKRNIINTMAALLPWEMRIKRIESHFGSVVASYFTFLRWLIWISVWLAVLPTCFIILPEMMVGESYGTGTRKNIPETEEKTAYDLKTIWDAEGVVKYSLMFYGYYGNDDTIGNRYMLPLAYLLTSLAAFAYSFIVVLKTMASNARQSQAGGADDEFPFSWKLFTEWDFMIGSQETANTKHASIITVFKETILEEQEKARVGNKYILLMLRITANVIIAVLLALSAYVIQLFVERSRQMELVKMKNPTYEPGFWNENELTIVMTTVATLFPNVLDLISVMEKYHPRTSLRLMLARIFVLNLLNLYTLFIALYNKQNDLLESSVQNTTSSLPPNCSFTLTTTIPSSTNDNSLINDVINNCTNENSVTSGKTNAGGGDDCWETTIGQEIYKLTIMDMVFVLGQILIVDIIRSYFIKHCNSLCCWDMERTFPEYPDFKTAENLLHLISNQGTIWLGSFFAPGLPILNLLKLLILLYVRCWTIMTFNAPQQRIFRASRSNNFYFALLLVMLFLCMLPPLLAIVAIAPSATCGPYSGRDKIYHIITSTINDHLPESATTVLSYSQSPAIILPVFMLLGMTIYYLVSVSRSLREANHRLAMQLEYERTEGRRKVYAMADAKHETATKTSGLSKGWGQAMSKVLPAKGNQSKMGNVALAAVAMMAKRQEGNSSSSTSGTQGGNAPARSPRQPGRYKQNNTSGGGGDAAARRFKDVVTTQKGVVNNIKASGGDRISASTADVREPPTIPVAVVKGKQSIKLNTPGNRNRSKQNVENAFMKIKTAKNKNKTSGMEHNERLEQGFDNGRQRTRPSQSSNQSRAYRGRGQSGRVSIEEEIDDEEEENDDDSYDDEGEDCKDNSNDDDDTEDDGDNVCNDNEYDDDDDDNNDGIFKPSKKSKNSSAVIHQPMPKNDSNKASFNPKIRTTTKDNNVSNKNENNNKSTTTMKTSKGRNTREPVDNSKTDPPPPPKGSSILERIRMFQKKSESTNKDLTTSQMSSDSPSPTTRIEEGEEDMTSGGDVTRNKMSVSGYLSKLRPKKNNSKNKNVDIEANNDEGWISNSVKGTKGNGNSKNGLKLDDKTTRQSRKGRFLTPYIDEDNDDDDDNDDGSDDNDNDIKKDDDSDDENIICEGERGKNDVHLTNKKNEINIHQKPKPVQQKLGPRNGKDVEMSTTDQTNTDRNNPKTGTSTFKLSIGKHKKNDRHGSKFRSVTEKKNGEPEVSLDIVDEHRQINSKGTKLKTKGKARDETKGKARDDTKGKGRDETASALPKIKVEDFSDVGEQVDEGRNESYEILNGDDKDDIKKTKNSSVSGVAPNNRPPNGSFVDDESSSARIRSRDRGEKENDPMKTADFDGKIEKVKGESGSPSNEIRKSKGRLAKWRKAAVTIMKRKKVEHGSRDGETMHCGNGSRMGDGRGNVRTDTSVAMDGKGTAGYHHDEGRGKINPAFEQVPVRNETLLLKQSNHVSNYFVRNGGSGGDSGSGGGGVGSGCRSGGVGNGGSSSSGGGGSGDGYNLKYGNGDLDIFDESLRNPIHSSKLKDRRASLAGIRPDRPSACDDDDEDNDKDDDDDDNDNNDRSTANQRNSNNVTTAAPINSIINFNSSVVRPNAIRGGRRSQPRRRPCLNPRHPMTEPVGQLVNGAIIYGLTNATLEEVVDEG